MAFFVSGFKALCLSFLFITITVDSHEHSRLKIFDILKHGGKNDGKCDNTKVIEEVWKSACACPSGGKILIPKGRFYVGGALVLSGPCKGKIDIVLDGTLLAPKDPGQIKKDTWIQFKYLNNLRISGRGTLDGEGKLAWTKNDCHKNSNCPQLAMNIGFAFVNDSSVEGITSLNSKMGHMNFFKANRFKITKVKIIAPDESPNTDGIKMGWTTHMRISDTHIGTGDDCIAILAGSTNIDVLNVTCGPGHGISVGSLGKNKDESDVSGLTVQDTVFKGTMNGIRIKTWESSAARITVSKFVYQNIKMIDVQNPIIIDQNYCPHPPCHVPKKGESHVQIKDLFIKNVHGTCMNKEALDLQCSKAYPCQNVTLYDIYIKRSKKAKINKKVDNGEAIAVCKNVKGTCRGKMSPNNCFA